MPVISYNCKGPKSIIQHANSGFLVEDHEEMAQHIVQYFRNPTLREHMHAQALRRSKDYQAEPIMTRFIENLGLIEDKPLVTSRSAA